MHLPRLLEEQDLLSCRSPRSLSDYSLQEPETWTKEVKLYKQARELLAPLYEQYLQSFKYLLV